MAVTIEAETHVGMSFGPGMFTDEEFEKVAHEVLQPDLTNYEYFVESYGTKFYRKYNEDAGLYEYKVHGVMEDMDPELCAQVYVDWEYRKKWDNYTMDLQLVRNESKDVDGLYWCVDYPWPMSDRDYTFIRDMRIMEIGGKKTWVVLAKFHDFPCKPEKNGVIRVTELKQACVMQSDGKVGARAFMYYYDNPKGMIPTWLINWVAKTGVPMFMSNMRDAVSRYKNFLEEKRKELGLEQLNNEERLKKLYKVEVF